MHKDWQRQKIATQLLTHLEQYAKAHNQQKLTAHVSITAKPFFKTRFLSDLSATICER